MKERHKSIHKLSESSAGDKQQTIMFVDDDDASLEHMSEIMRMNGYNVASYHDALSALAAIREGIGIDLVITDYRMPDMNGLEFVEALRHHHPVMPVIMLTAHGDIDTYFKAFNLGIFEFINKPVNKGEFLKIVNVSLGKGIFYRNQETQ